MTDEPARCLNIKRFRKGSSVLVITIKNLCIIMECEIRKFILNAKKPCVLKHLSTPWKLFDISFEEWCNRYDKANAGKKLDFEESNYFHNDSPQWERHRSKRPMKLTDFWDFQQNENTPESWITFSYKNVEEIPQSCREGIDFNFCGFPDVRDISFWLSSKGAHTPCHYDTYGCNIVVQVYGRKMWLLFPPDNNLTPVRVPYEESSVYSFETFYSPKDSSQLQHIEQTCYMCILEPGDVLVVPNKWWHYAESLTASLSINTWIPLRIDNEARFEECIVRYIIKKLTQSESNNELMQLLNPNEVGQLEEEREHLSILSYLYEIITKKADFDSGLNGFDYQYVDEAELLNITKSLQPHWVTKLSANDFGELVKQQSNRYKPETVRPKDAIEITMKQTLINSLCSPSIIRKVKELFLDYSKRQTCNDVA